jgi:predicted PurR-regulated permease PerM
VGARFGEMLETAPGRPESSGMAERPGPPMSYYAKITIVVVAVLVLVRAAWAVRNILLLVLVAAVLAVGLDPAVRRLERLGLPRGWAVSLIMLATIGFVLLFSGLVIPPVVRGVRQLASDIPGYIERLQAENSWFRDLARKYDLSTKLKSLTDRLPSLASASLGRILGITRSIASVIFNMLTILILTIYFLMALPRGERTAEDLMGGEHRHRNVRIFREALDRVGGYVSGNIAVSIIAGIVSFVFLRIMGVPFAAALALWVAIADLIPTVGATLGALAAVIVAFFSSTLDGTTTIIFFVVYQQVENYVIVPRVMRKAVDLSPAAVIVSVLIGGSLAGFAGALLALPIAAGVKVVIRDVWLGPRMQASTTASPLMPQGTGTTEIQPSS